MELHDSLKSEIRRTRRNSSLGDLHTIIASSKSCSAIYLRSRIGAMRVTSIRFSLASFLSVGCIPPRKLFMQELAGLSLPQQAGELRSMRELKRGSRSGVLSAWIRD